MRRTPQPSRPTSPFAAPISEQVWDAKYRLKESDGRPIDRTLDDTFSRVARAAAQAEKGGKRVQERWAARFHEAIGDFGFLPAGRILAGAGSGRAVTLFNCFVMGAIEDDLGAIFEAVKEASLTMQQGGGIGMDFSTLRPRGAPVTSIGADASGPVSFMDVWDAMCRTIMSAGARRGAMMACLRCDHPDIEAFVAAKADPARLRMFNLSVLVTDSFMRAVEEGGEWPLAFAGTTYKRVMARDLWRQIMRATYDYAEPGVVFIDRVNRTNNLGYCEEIFACNPCGEQNLPPYGACLLGSINLARLVLRPFTAEAQIDIAKLEERTRTAVRFLDNVIDISGYPLPAQRREALAKRRMGLGVTGLADALIFCDTRYGDAEAAGLTSLWMGAIERAAYLASAELAAEKGCFPLFDRERVLEGSKVAALAPDVRKEVTRHGLRNGCLTSVAPTGTISLFAGNVSSGIEPVFDFIYRRKILGRDGASGEEVVEDHAHAAYRAAFGPDMPLTEAFVTAASLMPADHLAMQAAAQAHVDSSISKTINCPEGIAFEDFEDVYLEAYRLGLKGCTTYRPNAVTGAVLSSNANVVVPPTLSLPTRGREPVESSSTDKPPNEAKYPSLSRDGIPSPLWGRIGGGKSRTAVLGSLESQSESANWMSSPLAREPVLAGYTYKLKWPGSDHALYITINDVESDGRRRPFEVFINTKNLEHYAWTVALTRMISAVFRRGGDVYFVAEELKAIFDPQGGRWMSGRYVPSLLAAIGEVIETHMARIGFLDKDEAAVPVAKEDARRDQPVLRHEPRASQGFPAVFCPRCSSADYVKAEGCWTCRACGYSTCT